MNISAISKNIGLILLINAAFMLMCVVVSILYGVDSSFSPLLLSAIITAVVGAFPFIFVKESIHIRTKEGFVVAVLAWIVSCVFGMLPYVLWGGEFTLVNAFFESVSGYTTTGATILQDVEALPPGLLLWRSSTHFMGGIGVVLFMLLLVPSMGTYRMKMSRVEVSSLSKEYFNFRTSQMLRVIATVYTTLAALETIALVIAGMDFFEAVNHSFSTVATGGFGTRNTSVQAFDSPAIELVIAIFMFLSGLHFGLLYSMIVKRSMNIFRNPIVKYYSFIVAASTLLITVSLCASGTIPNFWQALRHAFFQVTSLSSTTGFGSIDSTVWPVFSLIILIFLSIQCACSGSTTGGIKIDRFYILFASLKSSMRKKLHPNAYIPVKIGDHVVDDKTVSDVLQFIAVYFVVLIIGTLAVSLFENDLTLSFTSVVACLGNVGPGLGEIGPLGNYSGLETMSKIILSVLMLLGRLEIYSMLVIFYLFKKAA